MIGPYPLDTILTGDCRALSVALPEDSIDLIVTDPPYLQEYLYLYGWLAREVVRILKPGRYLLVYGGVEHLPTILDYLRVEGLTYFHTFALNHLSAHPQLWHKKLMAGWKPVVVFTKGPPAFVHWQSTMLNTSPDKRYHVWGQGEGPVRKWVDLLSFPGEVVLDPFTGGGTVPSVCRQLGRHYLAFEVDPVMAEVARQRVAATEGPLFTLPPPDPMELWKPDEKEEEVSN